MKKSKLGTFLVTLGLSCTFLLAGCAGIPSRGGG